MILGMSTSAFTQLHVVISLIGIAAGIIVVLGMLAARRMPALTAIFLVTTVLTSVTGFFFPIIKIGPPHIVGVVALVVLAPTLLALYVYQLAGSWRWIYVVGAVISLYLNAFVAVVQTFLKQPFFHALAPTGTEPPFAIAQGVVFVVAVVLGWLAVKRFRPTAA